MRRLIYRLATVWLGLAAPALASDLDDGVAAFRKEAYETAYRLLLPLAEAGDAEAQYRVGYMLRFGKGVTADRAAGLGWYERAAAQDHAWAMIGLGGVYRFGNPVQRNRDLAAQWYERAGDLGVTVGYEFAGDLFAEGPTEWNNAAEAIRLYAKAIRRYESRAETGDTDAQARLANLIVRGHGTPQDFPRASALLHAAAEAGNVDAQYYLGAWYDSSQRVYDDDNKRYPLVPPLTVIKPDIVEAFKWYELAARSDFEYGVNARNLIIRNMTPAQIAEGRARADAWHPKPPTPMR